MTLRILKSLGETKTSSRSLYIGESTLIAGCILLIAFALTACGRYHREPVTLTFVDPEWSDDIRDRSLQSDAVLQEFTRQTGIRVQRLPTPETNSAGIALVHDLLQMGESGPDIYGLPRQNVSAANEGLLLTVKNLRSLSTADPGWSFGEAQHSKDDGINVNK